MRYTRIICLLNVGIKIFSGVAGLYLSAHCKSPQMVYS